MNRISIQFLSGTTLNVASTEFMARYQAYVQAEPKSEVHKEQVPEVFEGPQALSVVDTNIFPEQDKLWCIPPILLGLFI
jgi:hypothetical protein